MFAQGGVSIPATRDGPATSNGIRGISVAAMAKQMHRSMAAVRNRAARLKIVVAKSRSQGLGLKARER